MKISHLIFLSFLFILLLFSITTYINFQQSKEVEKNTKYLTQSTAIVRESNRYQRNILTMSSAGRGYLLTGDKTFLESYKNSAFENELILKELFPLVKESDQQQLMQIKELSQKWMTDFLITLGDTAKRKGNTIRINGQDSSAVAFLGHENEKYQKLHADLRHFIGEEYARREAQKTILNTSIDNTRKISVYLTLISIIVGFVVAALLAHKLSRRILNMVGMANSIAKGDYAVKMKDKGVDELSKLSASLNYMSQVLAENFSLLKSKNEELDQFAHIVSHDLKAPLRGIGNVVTWIEEDHAHELSEKVNEYLKLIQGRLIRAENLIQGILSYARIETGVMEKEEVDTNDLVTEIRDNQVLTPPFRIDIDGGMPTFYTHKLLLFQVLSNLINNAVKYHNKQDGFVKIYSKEHADHYVFFVEDDGPGIAPSHQNKIFKIFQTLQERDSFESTGIGLSIVRKILDTRKEIITLKSELGKGSIFSFTWKK